MSNEQLLFGYGMTIDGNPHGGPVCPVYPPNTPARSALWKRAIAEVRAARPGEPAWGHPMLCAPGAPDPAEELLVALAVLGMGEPEAAAALRAVGPLPRTRLDR